MKAVCVGGYTYVHIYYIYTYIITCSTIHGPRISAHNIVAHTFTPVQSRHNVRRLTVQITPNATLQSHGERMQGSLADTE